MRFLFVVALLLTGCAKDPISTSATDNAQFKLEALFTHDGCTIYRFMDNGYYHYWTNCKGTIDSRVHTGKTSRPDNVVTDEVM